MDTTPTYPARFGSYEEFRAYRNAVNAKYHASPKGQANMRRNNSGPKATARFARYRQTEKYQTVQRRHKTSAKSKAAASAYQERRRIERPELAKARDAVRQARKRGMAKPKACSSCGAERWLHAHHHLGYAERHWLDVQWLCVPCHRMIH